MNRYIPFLALSEDQSFVYPYYATWAHQRALKSLTAPPEKGPFFLGEVGIPWLGTVLHTAKALESTMSAVDSSFVSALTLWNYNPHHTQEKGDGWNLEDFSIWSPSLRSFRMPNAIRPYAMILAGKPVSMQWEPFKPTKSFTLVFDAIDVRSRTSIIFVPEIHYRGQKLRIHASDNGNVKHHWIQQIVEYTHNNNNNESRKILTITI